MDIYVPFYKTETFLSKLRNENSRVANPLLVLPRASIWFVSHCDTFAIVDWKFDFDSVYVTGRKNETTIRLHRELFYENQCKRGHTVSEQDAIVNKSFGASLTNH